MSSSNRISTTLKVLLDRLSNHLKGFFPIWLCLFFLLGAAEFAFNGAWGVARVIGGLALLTIVCFLVIKPMNVVYGLMGTTGDIGLFFANFLVISAIFAGIYYWGFFYNSGISYDINQPHIEFDIFKNSHEDTITIVRNNKSMVYSLDSQTPNSYILVSEEIHYQRIDLLSVISNTVMTSLMQEPTELFSAGATYNKPQDMINRSDETVVPPSVTLSDKNVGKARAFLVLLIFQIIISWIFFGVFISLLYNKFRYES